ncbi:MAG: alcohol dehydrogenase catalytic domain-containing protein [Elusimicrobiota bacterium]|nr:alcohol dehydrogenase catalytic domain-containing protein [Elusimicrobiota bacterium]
MKAILARDGAAALAEVPIPAIGPGELLLRTEACGLCGTDVMKLDTRAKDAVLGHELCGVVEKAGAGAPFAPGERVVVSHHVPCLSCHYCAKGQESMCRQFKATNIDPGGFAEFVRIPAPHARHAAFKVPAGLDPLAASQMEPLACVLRNLRRVGVEKGDRVGIVGLGAVGQMTGQMLKVLGAEAFGLDLDPKRSRAFERWGAAHLERELDAIVFTAGTPKLVNDLLPNLRDGGAVNVFASFHPDPVLPLDLNQVYHRELTVVSSYSPCLSDLKAAFDLIASRRFVPETPLTFPFASFDAAVAAVKRRETLKSVLVPA